MRFSDRGLLILYLIGITTLSLSVFRGEAVSSDFFGSGVNAPNAFDGVSDQSVALKEDGDAMRAHDDGTRDLFRETEKKEIDNLVPETKKRVSLCSAITLDIVVPGGGHFYTGNYYQGLTFAALKLLGAYSIYYFYQEWQYSRSLYYSSRSANENLDPDHELEFHDPDGGYKTVEEYRREYDKAVQRITFAVIANAAVYIASVIFVFYDVREINEGAVPTFDLQFSCDKINGIVEGLVSFGYTLRI